MGARGYVGQLSGGVFSRLRQHAIPFETGGFFIIQNGVIRIFAERAIVRPGIVIKFIKTPLSFLDLFAAGDRGFIRVFLAAGARDL